MAENYSIWRALSSDCVIDLLFFDDPAVTAESYLDLLPTYFLPGLQSLPSNTILQGDGSPPRLILAIRKALDAKMPNSWIGRADSINSRTCSPDLVPFDFFWWRYEKDEIYKRWIL